MPFADTYYHCPGHPASRCLIHPTTAHHHHHNCTTNFHDAPTNHFLYGHVNAHDTNDDDDDDINAYDTYDDDEDDDDGDSNYHDEESGSGDRDGGGQPLPEQQRLHEWGQASPHGP